MDTNIFLMSQSEIFLRCLLQEETGCAQCAAQRCSVIVRLDSQEGLEQQLENIYLSDHGEEEEEEEEEDNTSIQSDSNAELLLGVRGDIVQHWVEENRDHIEDSEDFFDDLNVLQQDDVPDPHPESVISRGINNSQRFLEEIQSALNIEDGPLLPKRRRHNLEDVANIRKSEDAQTGKVMYSCTVCQRTFANKSNIRYHIACGDSRASLDCSLCEKTFKSSSHLTYHMRSAHTKERPYQCQDCHKSFHQLVKLKRHRLQHTGERPYKCAVCGKTFKTNYHMKEHTVIHSADMHYKCDKCERKFSDKNNLRRHVKSLHSEVNLYCERCDVVCQSKYDYDLHLATEHREAGALACQSCGKGFRTKKDLDRHEVTHFKVKPFACLQCDKGFSRKDHLKRHMVKVHSVGEVFEVLVENNNEKPEMEEGENVDDPMELTDPEPEDKTSVVMKDIRLPKIVGSINQLPEDIYNVRGFQTLNSILSSGSVSRETVRALLTNMTREETFVPATLNPVKKSLLNRYRTQSGLESEDFPRINVSEEQRLAASQALTRWLEENRE